MVKAIKVVLPIDKPDDTLILCGKIIEKDTLDGAASSLTGVIDMAGFGTKVTNAKAKRKEADTKDGSAQKKYELAANNCGLGKGQHKDVKNVIVWYVRQIKELLLVLHDGNEETLTEYGFNVVITTTGARKNIRIDLPLKPEDMVKLGEDIVEQHTTLGVGSPLIAALVDMAAFGTLVAATGVLIHDWDVLRGQVESLNNQALVIIGYAEAQTITTPDTIYHELGKIRKRLLQKFQGEEKTLEEFGFDVITTEFSPGKKKGKNNISIKGKVRDSETSAALGGSLLYLVETDTFTIADDDGNFTFETLPPGTYTIVAHKTGYQEPTIENITVTAGAVTTVNIDMVLETPASVGSISGMVTKTGLPAAATISVVSMAGGVVTDPSANYNIDAVPAGAQTVRAILTATGAVMDIPTTVVAGDNVVVNFAFP